MQVELVVSKQRADNIRDIPADIHVPAPGYWSRDRGVDDGEESRARATLPGAPIHTNVYEAFGNILRGCASTGLSHGHLLGHGVPGRMSAGCGLAHVCFADTVIWLETQKYWGPASHELMGRVHGLTLYSCHVGGDNAGAELLHALCEETGAIVRGYTGYVFVPGDGHFYLETGAAWQSATPGGGVPEPLAATPHELRMPPPKAPARFATIDGSSRHIQQGNIISARYLSTCFSTKPEQVEHFRRERAWEVLRCIHSHEPARLPGVPLAAAYGILAIEYRDADTKREQVLKLAILADFVLDLDTHLYYHASQSGMRSLGLF